MTWVKTSDNFAEDPRWEVAGADGLAIHVAALCYCNRNLTDGRLSLGVARRLFSVSDPNATIEALVATGFWAAADGGFEIVDYAEDQPSAEQVLARRKFNTERQARYQVAKRQREASNASPNASANASSNAYLDPTRPAPKEGGKGRGVNGSASATPPTPLPSEKRPSGRPTANGLVLKMGRGTWRR